MEAIAARKLKPRPDTSGDERGAGTRGASHPRDSLELLARARTGDQAARRLLLELYLPVLKHWARGRLPRPARTLCDTEDLVQDAVTGALKHLGHFEMRHPNALRGYLQQALTNRVRDVLRSCRRHPSPLPLEAEVASRGPSPLEQAIGRENLERYRRALLTLRASDRDLIVARMERRWDYGQLAETFGKPTPNAARVAVMRALCRLARAMNRRG